MNRCNSRNRIFTLIATSRHAENTPVYFLHCFLCGKKENMTSDLTAIRRDIRFLFVNLALCSKSHPFRQWKNFTYKHNSTCATRKPATRHAHYFAGKRNNRIFLLWGWSEIVSLSGGVVMTARVQNQHDTFEEVYRTLSQQFQLLVKAATWTV